MAPTQKSVRSTFKIAAIYVFALSTAVACSKFEVLKSSIGGKATVTQSAPPGTPVVAPTALTVSIDKVSTVYRGVDAEDDANHMWNLKMHTTHGANKITFDVAPMLKPAIVIGRMFHPLGTMEYYAEGICGDTMCSKFAVMLTVKDSSNGTTFQRVQFWNLNLNNQTPQKELMNTAHMNVHSAYESMSGESI